MKKDKQKTVLVDKYEKYRDIGEMFSTRSRVMKLSVPSNMRMLCAILDVKVESILHDFMWILSSSHIRDGTKQQRAKALKFFLTRNYGQSKYTKQQIKQMFNELSSNREIYETTDKLKGDDLELFWKSNHMYTEYWFKRWFNMNTREKDVNVLKEY